MILPKGARSFRLSEGCRGFKISSHVFFFFATGAMVLALLLLLVWLVVYRMAPSGSGYGKTTHEAHSDLKIYRYF